MKKIFFNVLLVFYSLVMSFTIIDKVDIFLGINAVLFFISTYFSFLIVKFITEIIENQLYCEEYLEISNYLPYIFGVSLLGRFLLILFNLKFNLSSQNVIIIYSLLHLFFIPIVFLIIKKRKNIMEVNWLKNLSMTVPFILYLILDIYSFQGGLN